MELLHRVAWPAVVVRRVVGLHAGQTKALLAQCSHGRGQRRSSATGRPRDAVADITHDIRLPGALAGQVSSCIRASWRLTRSYGTRTCCTQVTPATTSSASASIGTSSSTGARTGLLPIAGRASHCKWCSVRRHGFVGL